MVTVPMPIVSLPDSGPASTSERDVVVVLDHQDRAPRSRTSRLGLPFNYVHAIRVFALAYVGLGSVLFGRVETVPGRPDQ